MTSIFGLFGEPQKAKHLHLEEAAKRPKHLGHDYAVMQKFDGWFMYIDCIDGVWDVIRSKKGRELPSMRKYTKEFQATPAPSTLSFRLIFEAMIPNTIFKDMNGRFNQKAVELDNVVLQCHDLLFAKYPHSKFGARYDRLTGLVARLGLPAVKLVHILEVTSDKEHWLKHYSAILSLPYGEGIILKRYDAPYTSKARIADLLKIKCDLTLEMRVVGWEPGKPGSKYEHTLGKLIVEEACGQRHSVSGMTDAERNAWCADWDLINGAIVEIQAMNRLPNGSLREARYKAQRFDKTEID